MFVKKHDFFRVSLVGVVNVASIFVASAERRKIEKQHARATRTHYELHPCKPATTALGPVV